MILETPDSSEYHEYHSGYVQLAAGRDILAMLHEQPAEYRTVLASVDDTGAQYRYAHDKWSMKDLLCHVSDSERIFTYRALRVARGDVTPLAGFDENHYAAHANADSRTVSDLLDDLDAVRRATISLFRSFSHAELARSGIANDKPVSVRAIAHIVAGHAAHHLNILRERYLAGRG